MVSLANIPSKLNILGTKWKVVFLDDHKLGNDEEDLDGLCDYQASTISLYSKCGTPDYMWKTFFHEILEALKIELSVKLSHKDLDLLAIGLYQVLNDNRLLTKKD